MANEVKITIGADTKKADQAVKGFRQRLDAVSKKAKVARAKRNAANRELKPGPGKEVDHLVPLSKGGGNSRKNLRVVSRSTNRKKGAKTTTRRK